MSYKIYEQWLTPNKYSRPQTKVHSVKGIVIHWVANPNSTAKGNIAFFESRKNGGKGYGSAHEFIDLDGSVWKCIPEDEMAYHVGSKTYTSQALSELSSYPNNCTYGIECTHVDWNGSMTDATYNTLVDRVADLCKTFNLNPSQDLWLHREIVGWKDCHRWFVNNPTEWEKFKKLVSNKMANVSELKKIGEIEVLVPVLNIRESDSFSSKDVGNLYQGKVYPVYDESNGLYKLGLNEWTSASSKYVKFTPTLEELKEEVPPYELAHKSLEEGQKWAVENGISDGSNPNEPATRAQVWEMLRRYHENAEK